MSQNKLDNKLIKVPFDPAKFPFFYGWIVALGATIATIASIPGQTVGVSVFTEDLIKALNLSRINLSNAYMIGTIASSFIIPFAGSLTDKFGTRIMIVISSIGLGLSLIAISNCDRFIAFAGIDSFFLSFTCVVLCFLMIRFTGQGCMTMVSRIALGKWFNHRRGLATALSSIFVSLTFNGSPVFLNSMVTSMGFRNTYFILAVAIGIGVTIVCAILFRDNPEQCGLIMDGRNYDDPQHQHKRKISDVHKQFTRAEAVKTLAFWTFGLGCATHALLVTAIFFHMTDIGSQFGLTRDKSYEFFLLLAVVSLFSNLLSGWLSDKINLKWLLAAMMLFETLGLIGLCIFDSIFGRYLFAIGFGIVGGLFGILVTVTWPRFYGRQHLGAVSGLIMLVLVFSSAVGPSLFSLFNKLTGSYRVIIAASCLLPLAVLIMTIFTKNPQRKYGI